MKNYKCVKTFRSHDGLSYYYGQKVTSLTIDSLRNYEKINFVEDEEIDQPTNSPEAFENDMFSSGLGDSSFLDESISPDSSSFDGGSSSDFSGFEGGDFGGGGASGEY
nr:hypothetical protein [Pedobacter sp. ASV19]